MKNSFFMIISSFLPLALLNLFAENNSSMAQPQQGQPQMGQPQRGASSGHGLEAYSLPRGTITENDMPAVKAAIQQALGKISESMNSAGNRADYQNRLLIFVTRVDLFSLASLVENRSGLGVPVPPNWPKDTWSYWEDRP